jgi:hypothetical protein
MKKTLFAFFASLLLLAIPFSLRMAVKAQEATLTVDVGVICRNIVDRGPVEPGESFEATVDKLFCFTKIVGAKEPVDITHVWYYGETETFRIDLAVSSASWRTWSSKTIQTSEVGAWHVDILGPDGAVLKTLKFEIK